MVFVTAGFPPPSEARSITRPERSYRAPPVLLCSQRLSRLPKISYPFRMRWGRQIRPAPLRASARDEQHEPALGGSVGPWFRPETANPRTDGRGFHQIPCGATENRSRSGRQSSSGLISKTTQIRLSSRSSRRALGHDGQGARRRRCSRGNPLSKHLSALAEALRFGGRCPRDFRLGLCQHGTQRDGEGDERLVK
jgi:hypothetical protein